MQRRSAVEPQCSVTVIDLLLIILFTIQFYAISFSTQQCLMKFFASSDEVVMKKLNLHCSWILQ